MSECCIICGRGPLDTPSVPIYRVGPKGEPTDDWRCEYHLPDSQKPDQFTKELHSLLNEGSSDG